MNWIDGMSRAIGYMEDHLCEELDYEALARIAGISSFYFMRLFNLLTGMTVGEYVRARRLTLAGYDLIMSDARVIDIAYKYGYETHESFTKAFTRFHGIPPSAARESGAKLKSTNRLHIQVTLRGDKEMNYRIIEKEAFSVIGVKKRFTTDQGENFKMIPRFWDESMENGKFEQLCGLCKDKMGVMGICDVMEGDNFDYYIAVTKTGDQIPEGMNELKIPASTWAVFECVGPIPQAMQQVWKDIFSEWFPSNDYEHADAPELEVYDQGDSQKADYKSYIWIPVVKKKS